MLLPSLFGVNRVTRNRYCLSVRGTANRISRMNGDELVLPLMVSLV